MSVSVTDKGDGRERLVQFTWFKGEHLKTICEWRFNRGQMATGSWEDAWTNLLIFLMMESLLPENQMISYWECLT